MATTIPPWKINTFTKNSPENVDFELWKAGVDRFTDPILRYPPGGSVPHELDYLRGMHSPKSLKLLRDFLIKSLGINSIVLTSIWLDKIAKVSPLGLGISKANRELGDLAIVIRRRDRSDKFISMWVLQAKKLPNPTSKLPSDLPTKKEIELLEKCPEFDFIRADKTKTRIKLQSDFGGSHLTYTHWHFLSLFNKPTSYITGSNPIEWRWSATASSPSHSSFASAVLEQAKNSGKFGARVDTTCSNVEWRKLWLELMKFGVAKPTSGFAGGNTSNTAAFLLGLRNPHLALVKAYVMGTYTLAQSFTFTRRYGLGNAHTSVSTTGFSPDALKNIDLNDLETFSQWCNTEQNLEFDQVDGGGNGGDTPPTDPPSDDDDGAGGIKSMLIIDIIGGRESRSLDYKMRIK